MPRRSCTGTAWSRSRASSSAWWLWGALGIGLLLLAGMAWSLFASLRKDKAAAD
jgi:hypothetical protein